ncbi:MAG: hypothetical protein R3E39_15375 [Anaerolineae bacterium]
MPLHVFWDNEEKNIIRCESEGKWTWREYHHALDEIVGMVNAVDYRVDLINSQREGSTMPPGSPIPHFKRAAQAMPPNFAMNIVVISSHVVRVMASVMSRMPNNDMDSIEMVVSLQDAYALIARDRAKALLPAAN